MPHHVFISHAHEDADAATSILKALETRGVRCWVAPRDVPPGGSYAEAILTAIENASCFVLVYSQNSNASRHVLREVERALTLGINIIPVRFDTSSVSKSLDYLLATVHWLSVIAEPREVGIGDAAARIASTITVADGDFVAPPVPPPPLVVPPVAVPPPRRSSAAPIFVCLVLALLAVGGLAFAIRTVTRAISHQSSASPTPSEPAKLITSAETPATPAASVAAPPVAAPPEVAAAPLATAAPIPAETAPTPAETAPTPAETAEETVEAIPDATSAPSSANLPRETPLGTVRRYYNYLSERNTIKAYELLSTEYRSRENFVTYTRSFASTVSLRFVSAHEISSRGGVASVYVAFEKNNQKFGRIEWRGPIELTSEASGWRINSLRGLRPSSVHR